MIPYLETLDISPASSNISIYSRSHHPGIVRSGMPHVMVIDHAGVIQYQGAPNGIRDLVKRLLKKVPKRYLGKLPYKGETLKIAKSIEAGATVGRQLKKLEELSGTDSEASDLIQKIRQRYDKRLHAALHLFPENTSVALRQIKSLAIELKGSVYGDEIQRLYSRKKNDPITKRLLTLSKRYQKYKKNYEKLLRDGEIPAGQHTTAENLVNKLHTLAKDASGTPLSPRIMDYLQGL